MDRVIPVASVIERDDIAFLCGLLMGLKLSLAIERSRIWQGANTRRNINFLDAAVKELELVVNRITLEKNHGGENNDHSEQGEQTGSEPAQEVL